MTYTLIENRLVSGSGLLKIPQDKKYRDFVVYLQCVRKPSSEYLNFDWNPPKSVYARMSYVRKGFIYKSALMEFEKISLRLTADISGQTLLAIQCAYAGMLQSVYNLANCISECLPFSITNHTEDMHALLDVPEEIIVAVHTNAAIELNLYGLEYTQCGDTEPAEIPEPPEPPIRELLPPGEPIGDITPPYPENDIITSPNPLDETLPPDGEEFPQGAACVRYNIRINYTEVGGENSTLELAYFGAIEDISIQSIGGFSGIYVLSRGFAPNAGSTCLDESEYVGFRTYSGGNDITDYSVISITEVVDN